MRGNYRNGTGEAQALLPSSQWQLLAMAEAALGLESDCEAKSGRVLEYSEFSLFSLVKESSLVYLGACQEDSVRISCEDLLPFIT